MIVIKFAKKWVCLNSGASTCKRILKELRVRHSAVGCCCFCGARLILCLDRHLVCSDSVSFAAQGKFRQEPKREMDLWNPTWLLVFQSPPGALCISLLPRVVRVWSKISRSLTPSGQELSTCSVDVKRISPLLWWKSSDEQVNHDERHFCSCRLNFLCELWRQIPNKQKLFFKIF